MNAGKEAAGGTPPGEAIPERLRPVAPGRYRDFVPVGEGGMGVVYLALDTELDRRVAMKIVRPGDAPRGAPPKTPLELRPPAKGTDASESFEELRERFLREAVVTGHMEHPGVVPVYEIGQTETGVPYYTMRFVRGKRTLRDAMAAAATAEDRLALLEPFLKVCDTLAYAHARGVLHRDLKPENVAIGEFGEVVVLDWGLAKVRPRREDAKRESVQRLDLATRGSETLPGVLGTPGYLSPEAARSEVDEVDARSDVYSLGCLLFECLTGRVPFDPKDLVPYLSRLASEEAPDPRSVEPAVPAGLAAICRQALARDRDARLPSAAELAARVRGWEHATAVEREVDAWLRDAEAAIDGAEPLRGEALLRQADRAAGSASKALDRHPDDPRARDLLARAGALRERGIGERERAARNRALQRTAIVVLAVAVGAAAVVGALLDERRREAEASAERARTAEAVARDEKARADQERDAAKAAHTQAEAEKAKATAAEERATTQLGLLNRTHNFLLFELRDSLLPMGRLDLLEEVANKTLEATVDADPRTAPDDTLRNRSVALDILGDVRAARDDVDGALEAYRGALALTETLAARHPENVVYQRDLTIDRARIADMFEERGDVDAALAEYREALRIVRALREKEPDNPQWRHDLAVNLNYVGSALLAKDQAAEAIGLHREALELRRTLLAEQPGDLAWQRELGVTLNTLGNAQLALGEADAAVASYREALAVQGRVAAADPGNLRWQHDLSVYWRNLGRVHREKGDLPAALEAYRSCLDITRRLVAGETGHAGWRGDFLSALDAVGSVLAEAGRPDEALEAYGEVLAVRRRLADEAPDRPVLLDAVAETLDGIADVQRQRGDHTSALEAHREMLAIYERLAERQPADPGWRRLVSVAHNDVGDDLLALGQAEKAAGSHRASLAIVDPLATATPENLLWQTDVAVTLYKLAQAAAASPDGRAEARASLERGLTILRGLKETGRLDAAREGWIHDFEESLRKVDSGGV